MSRYAEAGAATTLHATFSMRGTPAAQWGQTAPRTFRLGQHPFGGSGATPGPAPTSTAHPAVQQRRGSPRVSPGTWCCLCKVLRKACSQSIPLQFSSRIHHVVTSECLWEETEAQLLPRKPPQCCRVRPLHGLCSLTAAGASCR